MRLIRPAAALAMLSAVTLALSGASAASPNVLTLTDIPGDANGINGQILGGTPGDGGTATPGSQAGNDLLKVELASKFAPKKSKKSKPVCNGMTLTMTLSDAPAAMSRFRISTATAANDVFILLDYDTATGTTEIRYAHGDVDETIDATVPAKVEGPKITMTLTETDLKAIGESLKSVFIAPDAQVSKSVQGMLYFPIIDKMAGGSDFKVCG